MPALPAGRAAPEPAPLRIALLVSSLSTGGAERVASELSTRWVRAGHHVAIVTLADASGDTYDVAPEVERVALDLMRPSPNPVVGAARALGRVRELRRAIAALRPDIVVSFGDRLNVQALLATAGTRVPTFVSERTDPRHAPNTWPWKLLRLLLYRAADGVVVQTESVAAWARTLWPRVRVIPNFVAVPAQQADPGAEVATKTLVAMGRLERVKGFDVLLEAFVRVAPAHPDWRLEVLGDGPQRAPLQAKIDELGLSARVALAGRAKDPVPRLAAAHLFALSSRREGFPNALLEAMACGLPAVAVDCASGPAEIVTDGEDGLLVPQGDVAALAAALDRLMGSRGERARMGRNARRVTERFAPERVLAMWSELLEAARRRRRPARRP